MTANPACWVSWVPLRSGLSKEQRAGARAKRRVDEPSTVMGRRARRPSDAFPRARARSSPILYSLHRGSRAEPSLFPDTGVVIDVFCFRAPPLLAPGRHRRTPTEEDTMREIAEMFVPKAMYGQVPVRMMPPVRTLTGLAGWGATAGFGLFWMIGDESFMWLKVRALCVCHPTNRTEPFDSKQETSSFIGTV